MMKNRISNAAIDGNAVKGGGYSGKMNGPLMCDTESLRGYPPAIRSLPFCVWKMEEAGGRRTKLPYNPRSGFRAAVNNPGTFSDMDVAIGALASGGYDGVGINISGNVGCIDVDKCVDEDGCFSGIAGEVLALLPDAFTEFSPSGRGLHLYFRVPEGFTYDTDDFYINNGKLGLEIYLPGVTKHFLTVTGHVYRSGSMDVDLDALERFRDQFMKRKRLKAVIVQPPEGGSVLNDAEVLYKCAHSQGGQNFVRYYNGDWENPGDVNWSQSQADMSVCRRLAFFCRGDLEQMDRLFRQSCLMRDKWDRALSGSTYGQVTLTNAVSGCSAFYEPEHKEILEADFSVLHDSPADSDCEDDATGTTDAEADTGNNALSRAESRDAVISADNGDTAENTDTADKADTAENAGTADNAAALDEWLSRDLDLEDVISDSFLELAAWAYKDDLARYMQVKDKVPKKLGIRRFEKEMKKHLLSSRESCAARMEMLSLTGCDTKAMIVPENWLVTDNGIWHMEQCFDELKPVPVSSEPVYVSAKVVNVDDDTEKLEVTYRRNGRYKTLVAPRSDFMNKNAVIKYADFGFPVSSASAGNMTKYLADMEAANNHAIPVKRGINRAGWIGNEFYPYEMKDAVQFHDDDTGTTNLVEALHTHGSEEKWLELAAQVRAYPFARFMLAVSFASPLVSKLAHRNIYTHTWYESRGGKTAVAKFGLSVWGNPEMLMGTYNATLFGLEQRCATLKHLPVVLDELQSLKEKYMSVNDVVYTLGNGIGKTRGKIGSGIREIAGWSNCILSTGEQPMSTDSSMDGVNTRLLEINACPLMNGHGEVDAGLGMRLHTEAAMNYGFAGKRFIRYLAREVLVNDAHSLAADYQVILERLAQAIPAEARSNPHFSGLALIALGDYYSSVSVFGLEREQAVDEAVSMAASVMDQILADQPKDNVEAAWDFIADWIASNSAHFINPNAPVNSLYPPKEVSPIYGLIEKEKVYVIATQMNDALTGAGFVYRKCIKGFQRNSYIDTFVDSEGKRRSQTARVIKGNQSRVYALNLKQEKPDEAGTTASQIQVLHGSQGQYSIDEWPAFTDEPAAPVE